jgi:hypothetical protein
MKTEGTSDDLSEGKQEGSSELETFSVFVVPGINYVCRIMNICMKSCDMKKLNVVTQKCVINEVCICNRPRKTVCDLIWKIWRLVTFFLCESCS